MDTIHIIIPPNKLPDYSEIAKYSMSQRFVKDSIQLDIYRLSPISTLHSNQDSNPNESFTTVVGQIII